MSREYQNLLVACKSPPSPTPSWVGRKNTQPTYMKRLRTKLIYRDQQQPCGYVQTLNPPHFWHLFSHPISPTPIGRCHWKRLCTSRLLWLQDSKRRLKVDWRTNEEPFKVMFPTPDPHPLPLHRTGFVCFPGERWETGIPGSDHRSTQWPYKHMVNTIQSIQSLYSNISNIHRFTRFPTIKLEKYKFSE